MSPQGGRGAWRPPTPGSDPERRLEELGLVLPEARRPVGSYLPAVTEGSLVFVAGQAAYADGRWVTGILGLDMTVDEGREAARLAGLNVLAALKAHLGSLDRVRRVVKVLGMVHASQDFVQHPAVIDGFSDLMVDVFGERGRHARSAVGMSSLPFGAAVEVEAIVAI